MFCRLAEKGYGWHSRVLFCALAFLSSGSGSQAISGQVRIQQWTTELGLPQNRIACIKQTRDGYLWVGTWYGVARFNGVSFRVYNKDNTAELVDETINGLAEDQDGTLWIGTSDGLVGYRNFTFHRFTTKDGLPSNTIWKLASCRTGGVWALSGSVVIKFDRGKVLGTWNIGEDRMIRTLQEGEDGQLNAVCRDKWVSISPDSRQARTNYVHDIFAEDWKTGVVSKKSNCLWVGGPDGLEMICNGSSKDFNGNETADMGVDALFEDSAGDLWVAYRNARIYNFHGQSWSQMELGESAKSSSMIAFEEDHEGNIWVGTTRGLFRIQSLPVRTYTMLDGLPDDFVCSVCADSDGTIWAGTNEGICRVKNAHVLKLGATEPNFKSRDRCVWPNGKGGLFFAKERLGLYEFQDGNFAHRAPESALGGPVGASYRDHSGRFWFGITNGVTCLENGKFIPLSGPRELNYVRSILEDKNGDFWFGTRDNGLFRYRKRTFEQFTIAQGLANNSIWSIHQDAKGAVWCGTPKGLSRFANGKFFTFTRRHGLVENVINCILEDDLGFIWLGGMLGISRIERKELEAVAEGRADEVQCALINTADGMESSETNGERQPSGCKDRDGKLWFPTIQGLVVIDPATFKLRQPHIQLEQVVADHEILYGDTHGVNPSAGREGSTIRVPHKNKIGPDGIIRLDAGRAAFVEFYFTANTFVDAMHTRYKYRLSGADRGWQETTEPVARYTNLRPGTHRFEVYAADHHGAPWSAASAQFSFTLARHFWETWTFYILSGGVVVGIAAGIQAYRLRWQHRLLKLEEQRTLANERARIARDLHDDLGTALTGLALELDVVGRTSEVEPRITERLSKTAKNTREMAERMREVVWSVNPKCDTLSSLASFLEQQTTQFLSTDAIAARVEFPEDIPPLALGAEARHQLALSVREALTNVVRHAEATEVVLKIAIENGHILVQVKDNGNGLPPGNKIGHGLENMKTRIESIGGTFECAANNASGTTVSFRLPVPK